MEKYITIPTSDEFEINGILNWKDKSEKLIILVHGLTGYMTEAHYYAAKEYFTERGYTVFRFNFYDGWEKNRDLRTSSIETHSQDLESILTYFQDEYKEVNVVSHSLWWPSVIGVKEVPQNTKKLIFWDPAFDPGVLKFSQQWEIKLFNWWDGRDIQVSKEMIEQRGQNHMENLKEFQFNSDNMYIIYAWANTKVDFKSMTDSLGIGSCIIKWANHGFTQEWKYEELFEKTLEFIEK